MSATFSLLLCICNRRGCGSFSIRADLEAEATHQHERGRWGKSSQEKKEEADMQTLKTRTGSERKSEMRCVNGLMKRERDTERMSVRTEMRLPKRQIRCDKEKMNSIKKNL